MRQDYTVTVDRIERYRAFDGVINEIFGRSNLGEHVKFHIVRSVDSTPLEVFATYQFSAAFHSTLRDGTITLESVREFVRL